MENRELIETFADLLSGSIWEIDWLDIQETKLGDQTFLEFVEWLEEEQTKFPFIDEVQHKIVYITWNKMVKGLELLEKHQPDHYQAAIDSANRGNVDTTNMWLQYSLFSTLKYII